MNSAVESLDERQPVDSHDPRGLPPLSGELVSLLGLPADLPEELSITQVAELTKMNPHTLRYWERSGLLCVGRNVAGRRVYDRDAVGQVVFVIRLRLSGMSIETIRRYVGLVNAGEHTAPQRLALMRSHRATIQDQLNQLQAALAVIDYKIAVYGGADAS